MSLLDTNAQGSSPQHALYIILASPSTGIEIDFVVDLWIIYMQYHGTQ
jgi:hypothetical protein